MIWSLVENLTQLEGVNRRVIDTKGSPDLRQLQWAVTARVAACADFFGLQPRDPEEVEPMCTRVLRERKRQAVALVDALDSATRPLGSPLSPEIGGARMALYRQLALLERPAEPQPPGDWWLENGYRLEKIVGDLVYPTSVEFDHQGRLYILEGGYSYPAAEAVARVLRLDPSGPVEIARDFRGPATSLTWYQGAFYIAEGGYPGQITRLSADGQERVTLIGDLHTGGDHFTTDLVFGPDGAMYFGVGSVSNAAVVGFEEMMMWGSIRPRLHDIPARDLKLRGINFEMLTGKLGETVKTGAFKPFGEPSHPGEVIKGQLRASSLVYRAAPDGSALEVHADGLRNPYGLGFDAQGRLIAVDQGMDLRGPRAIANDWEPVWEVKRGEWYGWPDFASGLPVTNPRFQAPGMPAPDFILAEHPPLAGQPLARLTPHSGSVKFAFAPGGAFGYAGQMFVAQVGDFSPLTQPLAEHTGFRVVRLNLATGQEHEFYINLKPNRGATGPERPLAVKFSPDGADMYILDFGLLRTYAMTMVPKAGTGALWRVTRES